MLSNSLQPELLKVGFFMSPKGGAESPSTIEESVLYFELLTKGEAFHPESKRVCGPGSVFTHSHGQSTIYQSPEKVGYECLTLSFFIDKEPGKRFSFPRCFQWMEVTSLQMFTREVLHAAHFEKMRLSDLGQYIWSTLLFRLSRSETHIQEQNHPKPVSRVIDLINSNSGKHWGMRELAENVGWSASHLHAEFKKATGSTPHHFLMQRRLAQARHHLVKSSDPIKQIAYECGFSTTENFCRSFKKNHGQTASDFRRTYQAHPSHR